MSVHQCRLWFSEFQVLAPVAQWDVQQSRWTAGPLVSVSKAVARHYPLLKHKFGPFIEISSASWQEVKLCQEEGPILSCSVVAAHQAPMSRRFASAQASEYMQLLNA